MPGPNRWRGLRPLWLAALALMLMTTVGCAMATQQHVLQGDGPWQRFIVKYREGSAPRADSAAVQPRLDAAAKAVAAETGITLRWTHRMGIGADLVTASAPLDRTQAQRLLAHWQADPDVEYAEVDGMMTIGPVPEPPVR